MSPSRFPLHRLAQAVVTPLPEPLRENAALTFPSAVFGAANACLAFLLFSLIGFRGIALVLVTLMYAASAAVWMFASFPDTYACTTLGHERLSLVLSARSRVAAMGAAGGIERDRDFRDATTNLAGHASGRECPFAR
jgi:hypothetical protein